ncbi:hypothetical protein ACQPW3_02855 [Actinosynnema sp. CA-248983]
MDHWLVRSLPVPVALLAEVRADAAWAAPKFSPAGRSASGRR